MHQSCFDRWVLNGSGSDSAQLSCLSCRHAFDRSQYESNPDPWSAADVQSTLAEEANESDDDKSDNQEEDDSDNDSDDDSNDDSDDHSDNSESNEPPAKRTTRQSKGLTETPDARSLRRQSRNRE